MADEQAGEPPAKRARQSADAAAPEEMAWAKHETVFTNHKGGMVGYDKERVKQIVYEMSKDSPHFRNEQRKLQQTEARIARLRAQAARLAPQELQGHTRRADAKVAQLLAGRDLSRTWIHVDLDAFYASVEELDDPSLKQKPMGVGGIGMLCTANYVARRYGVRSAMPGFIARRLCPELVFVKPDFSKYTKASEAVRAIFRDYDADLEAASLDEAYLDVTDFCAATGKSGADVAAEMRARVRAETQLTCSCGVAPNATLAKICSDLNKPDGQHVLGSDPDTIRAFVAALPVRKVPGIGKVGQQELNALGCETCGDLLQQRGLLGALFSETALDSFLAAALGLGRTRHAQPLREGEVGRKGMSVERTFAPLSTPAELEAKCCELAGKLAEDLEAEGLKGKTLTLKLKPPTFEVKTRAVTLPAFVAAEEDVRAAALRLLRAELPITVRLMGLRMSNFLQARVPPGQQQLASFFRPKGAGAAAEEGGAAAEAGASRDSGAEEPAEAGPSDASEAGAAREAEAGSRASPEGKPRARKLWACQLCTFDENPRHSLRCLVCDERRGTAPRLPEPQPSAAEAGPPPDRGEQPEAAAAAATVEGAAAAGARVCPQCGEAVQPGKAQEHADWHLALSLSGQRAPVKAGGGRGGEGSKVKGRVPSITRYFGSKGGKPPDRVSGKR